MEGIELVGDIDNQHCLHAHLPAEFPAGQVRLIVLLPEEDAAGQPMGARHRQRMVD